MAATIASGTVPVAIDGRMVVAFCVSEVGRTQRFEISFEALEDRFVATSIMSDDMLAAFERGCARILEKASRLMQDGQFTNGSILLRTEDF